MIAEALFENKLCFGSKNSRKNIFFLLLEKNSADSLFCNRSFKVYRVVFKSSKENYRKFRKISENKDKISEDSQKFQYTKSQVTKFLKLSDIKGVEGRPFWHILTLSRDCEITKNSKGEVKKILLL